MRRLRPPEADIGVYRAPVQSFFALIGFFALLLVIFALVERVGIRAGFVPQGVLAAALVITALVSLMANGRRPADYYAAGRAVAPVFGGLAGAGGLAGLILIAAASGPLRSGWTAIAAGCGLAAGLLILAFAIAPPLSRFGRFSPADFLAARFGGAPARLVAALVAAAASFALLAAVLRPAAGLFSALTGIPVEHGLYAVSGIALFAALPGGVRSVTWTNVIQYLLIGLAALGTAMFLSVREVVLAGEAADLGTLAWRVEALAQGSALQLAPTFILTAFGVATLPQVLSRVLAAPSAREAGVTSIWILLCATVLAALTLVLGQSLAAAGGLASLGDLAADLTQPDPLIFATLPSVMAGLLAAGALAALLATASAALAAGASALSHDLWDRFIDRKGAEGRRLFAARVILLAFAAAALWVNRHLSLNAADLAAWSLAFAAAGNFASLLLGLWWRRASASGAVLGSLAGFGLAVFLFLLHLGGLPAFPGIGISPAGAATLGVAAALVVTVAVSLVTPPPGQAVQDLVTVLHDPRNRGPMRRQLM